MSLFVTLALGLAVWRATRFLLDDTLIEGWRNHWYRWLWDDGAVADANDPDALRPASLWRHKLLQLSTCPHCVSAHLAWITVAVYMVTAPGVSWSFWPWAIAWWQVAGVASLLSIVTDFLEEE